jgi:ATP-dependent 26S proteasome regulatory subunit
MRSQLLICLERHAGVVVFATNLVQNYDQAFETRVRHIKFPMPDEKAREAIWQNHLPPQLPLAADMNTATLAMASHGFCGREIKNAVLDAACRAARGGRTFVNTDDFLSAVMRINQARREVRGEAIEPPLKSTSLFEHESARNAGKMPTLQEDAEHSRNTVHLQ